jgi:hypothetical protein
MTTTSINTSPVEGIDFNTTYTAYAQASAVSATNDPATPGLQMQLGMVAKGSNDTEFVFVKAGATINIGDCCIITSTTQLANPITTTLALLGVEVGFAQVAIANGSYGWLQRNGACSNINVAASCVQNVQLAATATAGVIDDAVTTGLKNINGVVITTTVTGAATVAGTLNNPVVGITNP